MVGVCTSPNAILTTPNMSTAPARATREEMAAAKLPLAYRDSCAHLLIPLNKCRRKTWYMPWKCEVRRGTQQ
jgi:hypothetical protein